MTEELVIREENMVDVQRMPMSLEGLMEMSKFLSKSTIVPVAYQNRPENCMIALDMANRMGLSPMAVMQNLHVIQGKPSFSGGAIGAMLQGYPKFKNVELNYVGVVGTDDRGAYVTAENMRTGKILTGATVTIKVAKAEGWYQKSGSKWQTMPELMLGYRAYAWFGRVYAPELLMGIQSTEEILDANNIREEELAVNNPYEVVEE